MKYFFNHQVSKVTNGVIDSVGLAELIELKKENILSELEKEVAVLRLLPAVRSGEIVNAVRSGDVAMGIMAEFAEEFFCAAFDGGNLASLKLLLEEAGDVEITDLQHDGLAHRAFKVGKFSPEFLEYFEKFLVQLMVEEEGDYDDIVDTLLFETQEKIRKMS